MEIRKWTWGKKTNTKNKTKHEILGEPQTVPGELFRKTSVLTDRIIYFGANFKVPQS